jgi:two-component system alkaline phosphatase synthesis response regulator PhoP
MKKILIVEDEQFLLDMYKIKLEREGFKVVTAFDGEEGLKVTRKEKPDLILLDIVMPKLDGYKFLEEVRKDPDIKDTMVYILSNLGQASEIKKGLEDGADAYLIKANITPGQLVAKINRAFDK